MEERCTWHTSRVTGENHPHGSPVNGVTIGDVVVLVRSAELSWCHALVNAITWQAHEGGRWSVEIRRGGQPVATRAFGRRKAAEAARDRFVEALTVMQPATDISYQSLLDSS